MWNVCTHCKLLPCMTWRGQPPVSYPAHLTITGITDNHSCCIMAAISVIIVHNKHWRMSSLESRDQRLRILACLGLYNKTDAGLIIFLMIPCIPGQAILYGLEVYLFGILSVLADLHKARCEKGPLCFSHSLAIFFLLFLSRKFNYMYSLDSQ